MNQPKLWVFPSDQEEPRRSSTDGGMNAKLGLPYGNMQKVAICFDVDGTLLREDGSPFITTLLLVACARQAWKNVKIVVWSGGGNKYAEQRARELGIADGVWKFMSKHQHAELRALGYQIIAIDDIQDTAIGDINLIVRNI